MDKVSDIKISFWEYSNSKKVHLQPDIVEYKPRLGAPMYDLIIGKATMHELGVVLDFKESTIQIDGKTHEEYHQSATQAGYGSVLTKEIDRLCSIGVIKWQPSAQWASPTFIIPKKDGTVCTISNFRELNKHIIQKPYPILKISTTLQELEGFTHATVLDLNMVY